MSDERESVPVGELTAPVVLQSLLSRVCPSCGGAKVPRMTFCTVCWFDLPRGVRNPCFELAGDVDRYLGAVTACLRYWASPDFRLRPWRKGAENAA